ncbi:MAG: menaquinone biosynthesis protein [Bacteroidetes bacterium]|nr:menaquinone biosynthesis protein [Bacteroidota bacterium]
MNTIRISAVSYYNTLPLIYGISQSGILKNYELRLDVPSLCAVRLLNDEADISLVPVGALPSFHEYNLIGKHCIGAVGNVKTVLLLSNVPVNQLRKIYLDTDSRTSVVLVKVLAKRLWKVSVEWESLEGKDPLNLATDEGVVLIGDKTFGKPNKFNFCYDLAGCWHELTGLPFVFAAWISTRPLPAEFSQQFEAALQWGVQHKEQSISLAKNLVISEAELIHYLKYDISFELDDAKKKGLELFLSYLREDRY